MPSPVLETSLGCLGDSTTFPFLPFENCATEQSIRSVFLGHITDTGRTRSVWVFGLWIWSLNVEKLKHKAQYKFVCHYTVIKHYLYKTMKPILTFMFLQLLKYIAYILITYTKYGSCL